MKLSARPLPAYAALLALVLLAGAPRQAAAHGYLAKPMSRNYVHSVHNIKGKDDSWYNYCPHCLAAGGPGEVSAGSTLVWPVGQAGFCGDMHSGQRDHEAGGRFATEDVGGTYEEGGVMEIKVGITAHHNGRFEFKICRILAPAPGQTWVQAEAAQMTQECFNQHVLVQADVEGSQRPFDQYAYLPFRVWGGYAFDLTPPSYTYYFTVPDGLGCDGVNARCVLQWHWVTGNSCTPPGTPDEFKEKAINECGPTAPYPEEFWNCADIRTIPRTNKPATPPSPPRPPRPPPAPPSPSPPPPPTLPPLVPGVGYPCQAGDSACFCAWKGKNGNFADDKQSCKGFFQCWQGGTAVFTSCAPGLRFNEAAGYCDWEANVPCLPPAGTTPVPSPSPTPVPAPEPSNPWDEWNNQPNVPAAACGPLQRDTDLYGGDLPAGTVVGVSSMVVCCDSCKARPECAAYTWVERDRTCFLKTSAGWLVRTGPAFVGVHSAVMLKPTSPAGPVPSPPLLPAASPPPPVRLSPPPPSPRPPPPSPRPPPPALRPPPPSPKPRALPPAVVVKPTNGATCGGLQKATDLWGADLPGGMMTGVQSFGACCAACRARAGCGAFTYVQKDRRCYLKASSGWAKKTSTLAQSATMKVMKIPAAAPPPVRRTPRRRLQRA